MHAIKHPGNFPLWGIEDEGRSCLSIVFVACTEAVILIPSVSHDFRLSAAIGLIKGPLYADNDHMMPESVTTVRKLGEGAFATGQSPAAVTLAGLCLFGHSS